LVALSVSSATFVGRAVAYQRRIQTPLNPAGAGEVGAVSLQRPRRVALAVDQDHRGVPPNLAKCFRAPVLWGGGLSVCALRSRFLRDVVRFSPFLFSHWNLTWGRKTGGGCSRARGPAPTGFKGVWILRWYATARPTNVADNTSQRDRHRRSRMGSALNRRGANKAIFAFVLSLSRESTHAQDGRSFCVHQHCCYRRVPRSSRDTERDALQSSFAT
jgi:hypothetical protein